MCNLQSPTIRDIYPAPERSSLAILFVSLKVVEHALIAEHPTLGDDCMVEPVPPLSLSLAGRLVAACSQLRNLIEQYDKAVDDALGCFSDDTPF